MASEKQTAVKTFLKFNDLLSDIKGCNPSGDDYMRAEMFMSRLYTEASSLDSIRVKRMLTSNRPDEIPPTSDAARLHISRSFLQACKWKNATVPKISDAVQQPTASGFVVEGDRLVPIMMSLNPIPKAVIEMMWCCVTANQIARQNAVPAAKSM